MTSNHIDGTIRSIVKSLQKLGAELPKPLANSIEDMNTIIEAARNLATPTPHQVYSAAVDAILDGRNPFEDTKVQGLAAARSLGESGGLTTGITTAAKARVQDALEQHADTVVEALKEAADAAGARLTAAHTILGDVELTDSEGILALGPTAAKAWVDAKAALATINEASICWYLLAEQTRFANSGIDPAFRLADLDLDTVERIGRKAQPWDIVRAGSTISLATRETAKARQNAYAKALEDRGAERDQAYSKAYQKMYGTVSLA